MTDPNNTKPPKSPLNDNDPMHTVSHVELRREYDLLIQSIDALENLYNSAVLRWNHQRAMWEDDIRRAEDAERRMRACQDETDKVLERLEDARAESAKARAECVKLGNELMLVKDANDCATRAYDKAAAERDELLRITRHAETTLARGLSSPSVRAAIRILRERPSTDPKPAPRVFDAIIKVDDRVVDFQVTAMPEEVRGNHLHQHPICEIDGMSLHSWGCPDLHEERVWLRGNNRAQDNATERMHFRSHERACAYADKVRRLLDAANEKWAMKAAA